MDTISRENNSILPIAGVLVGVLALILSGVALAKLSTANRSIEGLKESVTKIDSVEAEVRNVSSTAEQAKSAADGARSGINSLASQMQTAFNQVGTEIGNVKAEIEKMHTAPAAKAGGTKGEKAAPAVAGPGEYIVKAGDVSGTKIAKNLGVSIEDLKAVNPGVNWSHLAIGQKLKVPQKK